MSRASRRAGMESTLRTLEEDFRRDLIRALERCAGGRWGLFGQTDVALASYSPEQRERIEGPDARLLLTLGEEIEALRARLGFPEFDLYHRLITYRRRTSGNDPGEPKLAREFLTELGESP